MIAKYLTHDRRITFEIEGDSAKAIFTEIAAIQEVFDSEHKCGICGGTDLRFLRRIARKGTKVYEFFHLACRSKDERGYICGARFDFGQSTDDEDLFPKRKDKDGKYLPNGGWSKYTANSSNNNSAHESQEDWES
jgi:hypothetical protein